MFKSCQGDGSGEFFYSPGMCPGNMQINVMESDGDHFTEFCCQSGFSWDPRGCASLMTTGSTAVPILPVTQSFTTTITVTGFVAVHSPVVVLWASSDLSLFPADVASRRSALFPTSNTTSNTNINSIDLTNSTDSTSSKTGTGLSQPARIGIGLGVALGSITIFIVVSAWLFKVRRRRKRLLMQPRNNAGELDGTQPLWKRFFGREWRSELDQDGPTAELAADPEPAELATSQVPAELPGSYRYREPATGAAENKPGEGKVKEKQGDERKVDERANEKKDHERSAY
ncbi:hypothetical protein PFICI_10054 [Pestalotiopsis fici W106-1]|uniref:Uncharacterized protein n=1 Tax=Pestalotiopsis fici (strain W106-1 / CGMCC3.15140) TaxID=1229662 RepID=W3WXX1_PESFW|nr:uncharacterized protein PFICI_10054 [Pestalotiopsis fici W106-1]ETS77992.1 hypothetical protein PFICI_10054 [Pestalotiopsis fici W106-1]